MVEHKSADGGLPATELDSGLVVLANKELPAKRKAAGTGVCARGGAKVTAHWRKWRKMCSAH